MNWMNFANGLGNAGDILAGSESYNSIRRGQQANQLGRDTLGWQASNADANRAQASMLQTEQLQHAQEQQRKQQEFLQAMETLRQINEIARMQQEQNWRTGERVATQGWQGQQAGLDRSAAMDRTMAPLKFQYENDPMRQPISMSESALFGNSALAGVTPDRLRALGLGAVGQATIQDPMMTKAFGNSFTQMENNRVMQGIMNGLGLGIQPGLNPGSVNPFKAQPGAPAAPVNQQRKGNY